MQLLGFSANQVHPLDTLDAARDFLSGNAAARFVWADFGTEEVTPAPGAWRDSLMALTGAPILDLHLADATNPAHPSFFDTTHAYDMVIFRKLTFETSRQFAEAGHTIRRAAQGIAQYAPGFLPALARIDTQPVAFFVFDNVLVTVRPSPSRTIEQVRQRLLESCGAPRPASARRRRRRWCMASGRQPGPKT
jgi:hypothetical protein